MPEDLAKGSLATSILGLAKERAAEWKTESDAVPSETDALKKCIENYFPNIERLPDYQHLLEIIIFKINDVRYWSSAPFALKDLMKIVAETIGKECDSSTLYMFRHDMKKAIGPI